jgi:hypothetical protein
MDITLELLVGNNATGQSLDVPSSIERHGKSLG